MSESATQRTEREDFQATSDPALLESADRGEVQPAQLRAALQPLGAPAVGDPGHRLHPGPHRLARAHPRGGALPAHVRPVLVLHRRAEGGRGARPDDARGPHRGDAHLPLHPDRRRGAPRALLQPLLRRGRRARGGQPPGPPGGDERAPEPEFDELFDEMLKRRVDRLARQPEDLEMLVEAVTLYHMVIEGMLALTGQHFIIQYNEEVGTLPGFVEGFNNIARDEHRHVAFGARFLRDMAAGGPEATARPSRARWPRWRRSPTACFSRSGTTRARPRCSAPRWRRRARSR